MRFERFVGIDPSLRTGFVALSPYGEVIEMKEIERDGDDPARMSNLIQAVVDAVHDTDFVAIEGFGYASQKVSYSEGLVGAFGLSCIEGAFRMLMSPLPFSKIRWSERERQKEQVVLEVYKRWGFESDSNNVTDAYVLAQIARALNGQVELAKFQQEALNKISKE